MGRALLCAAVVLGALHVGNGEAHAGGYDTPILYSARHIGMGGTAVGYVGDPSALFHNPAGIAQVERFSVLGDFSLILGDIQAAPANPNGGFGDVGSLRSETTVAPFFLLGAAGRLTDWMTVGVAAYPVASAGAEFNYTSDFDEDFIDRTRLVFFELSAAAAFQIPSYPQLRLGLGYRVTFVSLEREQANQAEGVPPQIDFEASGQNFAGVRIGLQWEAIDDMLQLGLAYRHKTSTTIDGSGFVVGSEFDYVETKFVLPSRLSFGARFDYLDFGVAFDFEYAFQSQNDRADVLVGASSDMTNAVGNIYD
ncbi:MAG TPA: outer membrane protein transport protein [Polyangiaceae bacterium LLY-WYZ-15_(1-7)]|nr:hypothetical protein [Myxococcales bacterium]MAT23948.1 hypothetical protein [Sandaracinus sp.]HJK90466.1 outer membrane protein transport protein [Polyangiaceae bacterium LLY-WYZ-15_(1-7)]MBJ71606.1 hypothetical protein [Sandaracinus sp.]HJL00574.1 outer membrane protein transport protein [Polyangiaceae bacterium LLY-WYZ-15_(1-7)]